jgi:hypothetical protein
VPQHHPKDLTLRGEPHRVFPIPHRLKLLEGVGHARLEFHDRSSDEVKEVNMPYIGDYLRRHPRFEDRLGIFLEASRNRISLEASALGVRYYGPDQVPQ